MRLCSITPQSGVFYVRVYEVGHAASGLNISSVSSSTLPRVSLLMGSHHFAGTPRWRHFLRLASDTPRRSAAWSTSAQSISLRAFMSPIIRDDLSPRQGTMWAATKRKAAHTLWAVKNDEDTYVAIEAAIRNRTRQARKEAGFTQKRMAAWLGVELDAYKKWENRDGSTIPSRYHGNFLELTRTNAEWWVSGAGQRAITAPPPRQAEPELRPPAPRKARKSSTASSAN